MNRTWKYLMYLGIIFLVVVVAWDFYEASIGGRAEFSFTLIDMPRSKVFNPALEKHMDKYSITPISFATGE
jgi:hypothetical protein